MSSVFEKKKNVRFLSTFSADQTVRSGQRFAAGIANVLVQGEVEGEHTRTFFFYRLAVCLCIHQDPKGFFPSNFAQKGFLS